MKRQIPRVVALAATAILFCGCAAMQNQSRTTRGAVIGTATGAAAGSAIGAIVGGGEGAWKGAAIGAVVGGLAGTATGKYMDNQAREMEAVLAEQARVRREQDKLLVSMSSDIVFASGKAYVQPGARDKLRQFAQVLTKYPRTSIQVVGHTDSVGSEEMNYELSKKRARAVADELVRGGVSPTRVTTDGEGESRPVASNATREGRAQNRRVEIIVTPDSSFRASPSGGAEPH